ncbi:hypothetical protein E2542_SST31392 [Spatholobus suberectus]|nr:hypothetical protein E2542_SST31392 [Spatholobus suberectus]
MTDSVKLFYTVIQSQLIMYVRDINIISSIHIHLLTRFFWFCFRDPHTTPPHPTQPSPNSLRVDSLLSLSRSPTTAAALRRQCYPRHPSSSMQNSSSILAGTFSSSSFLFGL